MSSKVQAILFDKRLYTYNSALHWVYQHKFIPLKVDVTKRYYRFRLMWPSQYYYYRTYPITTGIKFILAYPRSI